GLAPPQAAGEASGQTSATEEAPMRPTIPLVALSCALLSLPALARNPTAQERADIEQLAYKYVFALDWRDPEAYAAAFAPDGVLNYGGGQAVGREQIAGVIKTMRDRE